MRKRRFGAAFIATVGLGAAAAAAPAIDVHAQRTQNPPARRPAVALPHLRAGHVLTRDASGTCRLRDSNACPPADQSSGACTTPPPIEVICPTALGVAGQVRVLAEGVCEVTYAPRCTPNATCNPPRPRRIPCPS